ncbi:MULTISPECIES: helix-turn-helix transcriptional regulator [unclassified Adlercreutzia]|uniref:helix-turn-helix transcriptional regulator n=1 Tax=unclassified Adlercreutzia TaxID=2636013 RepID=UPI0013EDA257|nr:MULTISPECIES: helix-turn-helix transcriptional regulator [unclassified Adlercreutzia]
MTGVESDEQRGVSAMELLGMVGFALLMGWMLVSFYWLFCDFPPGVPVDARDFAQMWIFVGTPAGYATLHALGKLPQFNLFALPGIAVGLVGSVALPLMAFALYGGVHAPLGLICAVNFLAGLAFAYLNVAWLDVCSRLRTLQYGRFTGLAFAGGVLLFGLAAISPETAQPTFILIYILCSTGLLVFASERADGNAERAPLESTADTWRFTAEIEPSFFMFGVVFALTFVYLFNFGQTYVLAGLLFALPGGLLIAVLSMLHREIGITSIQRILTFVTVAACIATPFLEGWMQLGCSCVVMTAWALFTCVNSAFIVKKSVSVRDVPLFRQAPMRLCVTALGFAAGWVIATVATMAFGAHAEAFTTIRLVVAIALVATVMAFLPVKSHHEVDGSSPDESDRARATTTVVSVSMSEAELFEARCAAVAKLYQLSPRESDILKFVAKGRNAAYIQEKLTISPHTVKSHIYNIYRKLDIHSQQKLMDFVEEFPLDADDIASR